MSTIDIGIVSLNQSIQIDILLIVHEIPTFTKIARTIATRSCLDISLALVNRLEEVYATIEIAKVIGATRIQRQVTLTAVMVQHTSLRELIRSSLKIVRNVSNLQILHSLLNDSSVVRSNNASLILVVLISNLSSEHRYTGVGSEIRLTVGSNSANSTIYIQRNVQDTSINLPVVIFTSLVTTERNDSITHTHTSEGSVVRDNVNRSSIIKPSNRRIDMILSICLQRDGNSTSTIGITLVLQTIRCSPSSSVIRQIVDRILRRERTLCTDNLSTISCLVNIGGQFLGDIIPLHSQSSNGGSLNTPIISLGQEYQALQISSSRNNDIAVTLYTHQDNALSSLDSNDLRSAINVLLSPTDRSRLLEGTVTVVDVEATSRLVGNVIKTVSTIEAILAILAIGTVSTIDTILTVSTYSLVVSLDTVLVPETVFTNSPNISGSSILSTLDSLCGTITKGKNNVFSVLLNIRDNDTLILQALERLDSSSIRCNRLLQTLDFVIVVLTGNEHTRNGE